MNLNLDFEQDLRWIGRDKGLKSWTGGWAQVVYHIHHHAAFLWQSQGMNEFALQFLAGMARPRQTAESPLKQGKTAETRLFILGNHYPKALLNSVRLLQYD